MRATYVHVAHAIIVELAGHMVPMRLGLGLEGGEEIMHLFVFLVVEQRLAGRSGLLIDKIRKAYSVDTVWIIYEWSVNDELR